VDLLLKSVGCFFVLFFCDFPCSPHSSPRSASPQNLPPLFTAPPPFFPCCRLPLGLQGVPLPGVYGGFFPPPGTLAPSVPFLFGSAWWPERDFPRNSPDARRLRPLCLYKFFSLRDVCISGFSHRRDFSVCAAGRGLASVSVCLHRPKWLLFLRTAGRLLTPSFLPWAFSIHLFPPLSFRCFVLLVYFRNDMLPPAVQLVERRRRQVRPTLVQLQLDRDTTPKPPPPVFCAPFSRDAPLPTSRPGSRP